MNYKLGRLPSHNNDLRRRLPLSRYYDLPIPPEYTNWKEKATKSLATVLGNDNYGDCTVAGAGHCEGIWTANLGKERVHTTKEIVDTYLYLTNGADSGLNMLYFLKYWQKTGLLGSKIGPYLSIPADFDTIKSCIAIFGTVYAGFAPVPDSWLEATIWDKITAGRGGHAIAMVDYEKDYIHISTWGEIRKLTRNGLRLFDELYIVLDTEWRDNHPTGFNAHQLVEDFNSLGGNEVVPPAPIPPVVPPIPDEPPLPPTPDPDPPIPVPTPNPIDWSLLIKTIIDLIKAILSICKN